MRLVWRCSAADGSAFPGPESPRSDSVERHVEAECCHPAEEERQREAKRAEPEQQWCVHGERHGDEHPDECGPETVYDIEPGNRPRLSHTHTDTTDSDSFYDSPVVLVPVPRYISWTPTRIDRFEYPSAIVGPVRVDTSQKAPTGYAPAARCGPRCEPCLARLLGRLAASRSVAGSLAGTSPGVVETLAPFSPVRLHRTSRLPSLLRCSLRCASRPSRGWLTASLRSARSRVALLPVRSRGSHSLTLAPNRAPLASRAPAVKRRLQSEQRREIRPFSVPVAAARPRTRGRASRGRSRAGDPAPRRRTGGSPR